MKKKLLRTFVGISLAFLMISCATTNATSNVDAKKATSPNKKLIVRGTENPEKLEKNDVMSVTNNVPNPEYFEFSNWSKIRIMNNLLDELKLHSELTNEQKYKLMSYIFDDLPKNTSDGIVREIRLGNFFSKQKGDAKNLVIRIGLMTPGKDAKVQNDKIIIIVSNAIKNQKSGEIIKDAGAFLSYDINATVITAYNNKLLTNIVRMNADVNNKADITKIGDLDAVMLSQSILADEDLSNDKKAHELCIKIIDKKDILPAVKIMAMMMEYDYRISLEDLEGSTKLWNEILAFSENVPGDMNPENLNSTNGESLYLLKELLK